MYRFRLYRTQDPTEVSGTGYVAEGVLFSNGYVALQWLDAESVGFYADFEEMKRIHCHHGYTSVQWLDEPYADDTDDAEETG